jgi:hypothetical protein
MILWSYRVLSLRDNPHIRFDSKAIIADQCFASSQTLFANNKGKSRFYVLVEIRISHMSEFSQSIYGDKSYWKKKNANAIVWIF